MQYCNLEEAFQNYKKPKKQRKDKKRSYSRENFRENENSRNPDNYRPTEINAWNSFNQDAYNNYNPYDPTEIDELNNYNEYHANPNVITKDSLSQLNNNVGKYGPHPESVINSQKIKRDNIPIPKQLINNNHNHNNYKNNHNNLENCSCQELIERILVCKECKDKIKLILKDEICSLTTEYRDIYEIVLYILLGIFVIYVLNSFTKIGKSLK